MYRGCRSPLIGDEDALVSAEVVIRPTATVSECSTTRMKDVKQHVGADTPSYHDAAERHRLQRQ